MSSGRLIYCRRKVLTSRDNASFCGNADSATLYCPHLPIADREISIDGNRGEANVDLFSNALPGCDRGEFIWLDNAGREFRIRPIAVGDCCTSAVAGGGGAVGQLQSAHIR